MLRQVRKRHIPWNEAAYWNEETTLTLENFLALLSYKKLPFGSFIYKPNSKLTNRGLI